VRRDVRHDGSSLLRDEQLGMAFAHDVRLSRA
jgi:hypothetical protein